MNLIHTRCLNRKSNETHLNTVTSFWTHRVIKLFGSFMDLELESSPSPPPDEGLRLALAASLVPPAEASTDTNPVGNTDALPVTCLFTSPLPPPPEAIMFSQQMLPYLELSSTLDSLKAFSPLGLVESAISVSEFIIVFSGFFMSHEETSF